MGNDVLKELELSEIYGSGSCSNDEEPTTTNDEVGIECFFRKKCRIHYLIA